MKRNGSWAVSLVAVALASAVLLAGCKPKENTGENAAASDTGAMADSGSMGAAPAAPAGGQSAALTDPQIAQIALSANAGDSARGKLAEQKATATDVKAFARTMVTDHSALNKQATELAQKLNVTPAPSAADSDLVSKVQGMTSELQGKSGKDFDKTYMDQEVSIHQLVLDDLDKTLIPSAQNAELKSLLTSARAKVDAHLKQAQAIQSKLK